jgi:hypothetical protein
MFLSILANICVALARFLVKSTLLTNKHELTLRVLSRIKLLSALYLGNKLHLFL